MLVALTTCHIWSTLTTVQMASPLDLAVCDVAVLSQGKNHGSVFVVVTLATFI